MLSLPDDYDILSLGLLNYQMQSMVVHLEDQPRGCLTNLNSTGQNMAVGRMLLENVTTESSTDQLSRKKPVVCVAMIQGFDGNGEGIVHRRCCSRKTPRTNQPKGPSEIHCNRTVEKRNEWMNNGILIVVSLVMAYYLPVFPLALPDCIFSLQYECDKEDRAEVEQTDGRKPESDIRGRGGYKQIEQTGASEIPVDYSTPVTCWALLRAYIQKLPSSRLSFNIKLAVMLFCIFPCVLYVKMGLWLTLKKKYIHESFKKHLPLPGQSAFPLNMGPVVSYVLPALALVLF